MLVDDLAARLRIPGDLDMVDYAIGPKYAYVEVSGEKGTAQGLAYFPAEEMGRGFSRRPSLERIREFVSSLNIFEKVLGVAMLNAVSQYLMWNMRLQRAVMEGNITDLIPGMCSGRVVVVGNMVPLVRKIPGDCDVFVLERSPRARQGAHPDFLAPRVLGNAEVVIITGATLVNDTVDSVISLSHHAKLRVLVGPTAGIAPWLLSGEVQYIAGTRVKDAERVKEIIRLGGGRWDFSKYCEEYVVPVGKY